MTLGSAMLIGGFILLAAALVSTIVCIVVGIRKKRDLERYFKEWY